MSFKELGLSEPILKSLEELDHKKPSEIQEQAIPIILAGKNVMAAAQTGTGKTAAFLLPVIENVLKKGHDGLAALVIVPTRELPLQIDQQVEGLGYFTGVSSLAIYGGKDGGSFGQEKGALT